MGKDRYVIIGNGAAGTAALETIIGKEPNARVTLISEEGFPFYSRPLITERMVGEISPTPSLYHFSKVEGLRMSRSYYLPRWKS